MSSDHPSSAASDAVVVVVDDWRGTFNLPDDVEKQLDAGPRWLVPVGGTLGILLALLVVMWWQVAPVRVWLVCAPIFLACVGAIALHLGGTRGATAAIAGATAAWVPGAAAVLAQGSLDGRLVMGLVAVGVLGRLVSVDRLRGQVARDRDAVHAARGGMRSEGWVVAAAGPPWDRELRVEPTDGRGGPWTGRHGDWRAVRPGVGHPVGIWRADSADAVVVLIPRNVR